MAAGLGFKTFTSGEVLTAADTNGYLMQGVLVFANASARDAAITSPQEGQCCYLKDTDAVLTYSGAAWVGFDDSNAIQNSIVDAKGDLVAASGADTPARLAVGSNGETLVADSSTSTGLRWQGSAIGKNAAINGACEIAQRGTAAVTQTDSAFNYPVDRFWVARSAGASGASAIQISSTTLDGFENAIRVQRTAANTSTADLQLGQTFELLNSVPFANKAVVVSFYARAGANYSPTSSALAVRLYTGTGTNQAGYGYNYTGTATPISQTATLTTSWQRFQYTATLSSTMKQMQFFTSMTPTGTAGANDYFDITGLQVELGSIATPFSRSQGTIQGELSACQRYYVRFTNGGAYQSIGGNTASSVTGITSSVPLPVQMRTTPTSIDVSNLGFTDNVNVVITGTLALVSSQSSPTKAYIAASSLSSAATQFRYYDLLTNNTATGYLGVNAEL